MKNIYQVAPEVGVLRIYRSTTFDLGTFDAFQGIKRDLSKHWGRRLTNAEVLRALVLSHPATNGTGAIHE